VVCFTTRLGLTLALGRKGNIVNNGHFALKAVAVVFCLFGALAAVDMALDVARGNISLNLGILGLFIGVGLLRYSRPWRVAALVCACLTAVASSVLGVAALISEQPIVYSGWGQTGTLPSFVGPAIAAVGLAIALWQLWVLTRPQVRQLFQLANAA